jgi:hypothetical protein
MTARNPGRLIAASICWFVAGACAAMDPLADVPPLAPQPRTAFSPSEPQPHVFARGMRIEKLADADVALAPVVDARQHPSASAFRLASFSSPGSPSPASAAVSKLQAAGIQAASRPDLENPKPELPRSAPKGAALKPAAIEPLTREVVPQRDERLSRIAGPHAPLQPAEVFSISRSDFFAEEIALAGLEAQLPRPGLLRGAAVEAEHQLAMLQQPLPSPGPALQPAEVLPIPAPSSPAAPRIPALDQDRPIGALTTHVMPTSGKLPTDIAAEKFQGDYPPWAARGYSDNVYFWDAPGMCFGGLRFEEVNLERYGYGCCHALQPFVSATHFAGATLALPYNIVNRPPWECIYPLGHYRPGSPVPYRKIWPEADVLAASGQCAVIAGLILLIP